MLAAQHSQLAFSQPSFMEIKSLIIWHIEANKKRSYSNE